jgi:hypothetical protein
MLLSVRPLAETAGNVIGSASLYFVHALLPIARLCGRKDVLARL